MNKNITVLSLFDGISTGLLSLKELGYQPLYYASEISENAITVAMKNHPEIIQLGDVRGVEYKNGYVYSKNEESPNKVSITRSKVDKIDLLIGGSPCDDLSSQHQVREGLKGEQSSLFYEYVRLLKDTNPKYFLLENVKMMKEDEDEITKLLGVEPIRINSKLVSAQNRDRLYWTNIPNIKQPEDKGILLKDIVEDGFVNRKKSFCITESYSRMVSTPGQVRRYMMGFGQMVFHDKEEYFRIVGETDKDRIEFSKKMRARRTGDGLIEGYDTPSARLLTPNEVETLQTLPKDYTLIEDFYYSSKGYNQYRGDMKRISLCGEGWTKDIIVHIFKNMEF